MSEPLTYPDVLGQLSHARLTLDGVLQCALGVFPVTTALDRPVEALLLLQNLVDQPLTLYLTIHVPMHDAEGNLLNLFTPKPRIRMPLPAAECGLLHIPITPQHPTPAGQRYTVQIEINVQKPEPANVIRLQSGGPPPNMLALSPFRLAVLREIDYTADEVALGQLAVTFEVLPGAIPAAASAPKPRYEALWTLHDFNPGSGPDEETVAEALQFADTLTVERVAAPLLARTSTVFAEAGMPLHPGEALFIAKLMSHVLSDNFDREQGFSRATSRWMERLGGLLEQDHAVAEPLDRLVNLLYTAVAHDAVMLGFTLVAFDTGADFGDVFEQSDYADRLVAALEGRAPASLEHVYVPLAMAGVLVHGRVTLPGEKLWRSLDQIQQARDGRIKLAGPGFKEVFAMLNLLVERAERLLREMKVPR